MDACDYAYGVCGVFCEQCASGGTGGSRSWCRNSSGSLGISTPWMAQDRRVRLRRVPRWAWFTEGYGCPTCLQIEKPWCAVMKCEKAKELGNCLLCDEFSECPHNEYQRTRYAYLLEHHERVKEIGLERYYAEEREKARKGTLLHDIREY